MSAQARRRLIAWTALASALVALATPTALADTQVTAGVRDRYGSSTVTIDQGQTLTFANSDIDSHNVTATTNGPDGKPLFQSETIDSGQSAPVLGTQYLSSGSYAFYCTLHSFMRATLVVTSAGTPTPRPGGSPTPGSPAGPGPVVVSAPKHARKHTKRRRGRHRARHRRAKRRHARHRRKKR